MQFNKSKVIGSFGAVLGGVVLTGIVAGVAGEQFGYSTAAFYLYGLFGHKLVAKLIGDKVK